MDKASPRRRPTGKQTTFGGLVLAFVIALYTFAQPILNERLGWNLPALPKSGSAVVAETKTDSETVSQPKTTEHITNTDLPKSKPGPLADRSVASPTKPTFKPVPVNDPNLRYGLLKDLGDERYVTPAGLMFTRGGAEGHRLDHLERHTVDDPQRPGKHGVFDGGMEGALATIDRAYERALTGEKTTKEVEAGRAIYTVDMGSRVGYIGGRDGNRQNKPMARRVKMVLDKDRVITAYPL